MSLQKKRKTIKDEHSYSTEELEDLGIFDDDESEDDDEEESWKNYG